MYGYDWWPHVCVVCHWDGEKIVNRACIVAFGYGFCIGRPSNIMRVQMTEMALYKPREEANPTEQEYMKFFHNRLDEARIK